MNFLKYISFCLLLLCLFNCSGLKSSWINFRAHYNTYYNGEKSFKKGIKKVKDQPLQINPEEPVRVHQIPSKAADKEFQNAIEKGAQVLRKFPDSKWADDALLLIGKSYYYKHNFYPALEKFEELKELTGSSHLKQQAVIWKGRTLLDLEQSQEAILFIQEELESTYWIPSLRAEAAVLLAEHYSMQANWEQASKSLRNAIVNLNARIIKARAFFLHGQVLERLERYGEAYFAYNQVALYFPDYEYVYWAGLKKGEVARKQGNLKLALSIYNSMLKDDKNFDRRDRIHYEIARTEEVKGDYKKAERLYKRILYAEFATTARPVKANVYYRLGKIYGNVYNNYNVAAAYFDSASSQASNIAAEQADGDARILASAYGQYISLQTQISRLDSLLWLGSLQPAQLDSVLNVVREQKRRSISKRLQQQALEDNRLANIGSSNRGAKNTSSSVYGFLNYRNARLVRESINEFKVVWGNRPLVDNWRRLEVVRSTALPDDTVDNEDDLAGDDDFPDANEPRIQVDVSKIPRTREEREQSTRKLIHAKYEMGNLFFLTLNIPDSAAVYFKDIVTRYPDSDLVPKAMYSLFELYHEQGNSQQALKWGNSILRDFPGTRYAYKVSRRLRGEKLTAAPVDSSKILRNQFEHIENSADTLSARRAERFRRLALAHHTSPLAPHIYYRAIREYVDLAKSDANSELYTRFLKARLTNGTESPQPVDSVRAMQDSAAMAVQKRDSLQAEYDSRFPFSGIYWDRVRTLIDEYDSTFANPPHQREIKALHEILAPEGKEGAIKTCRELGVRPRIKQGMDEFLANITYPDPVRDMQISGELTYRIWITEEGKVASYERTSAQVLPPVEEAFEKAIQEALLFEPVMVDGDPQKISCEITFPVKN